MSATGDVSHGTMWQWLSNRPVRWRIMAPAVGAVMGLALVAVAVFGSLAALREANAWESHTRDVLRHSADLESTFLLMVAELRAYRADGDITSLASYGAVREELAREHD